MRFKNNKLPAASSQEFKIFFLQPSAFSLSPSSLRPSPFALRLLPIFLSMLSAVSILFFPAGAHAAPKWTSSYLEAESLMEKENWRDAATALETAIADNDQEGEKIKLYGMRFGYFPHYRLGLCYYNLGKWDLAKKEFEKSMALSQYEESQKYLQLAAEKLKKSEEDKKAIDSAKKKEWDEYYIEAMDFMAQNEWMKASESIKRSLAIKPPVALSVKRDGKEVPYSPHLMSAKCYSNMKLEQKIILDELAVSLESEKSQETVDMLSRELPAVWVNP
ncbi:MAG: tetratricopeptide repeat protein [Nitrospinae bacterium]|nr:tetratricopeptide repeat protein [Nitrospinota bacterium]